MSLISVSTMFPESPSDGEESDDEESDEEASEEEESDEEESEEESDEEESEEESDEDESDEDESAEEASESEDDVSSCGAPSSPAVRSASSSAAPVLVFVWIGAVATGLASIAALTWGLTLTNDRNSLIDPLA